MLWTVRRAAQFLRIKYDAMFYHLAMGHIEAIRVGRNWRLVPEEVEDFAKRYFAGKNKKTAGDFVYPGDGGFFFNSPRDRLPPDTRGKAARMEGRRGKLVRGPLRDRRVLLPETGRVTQLELF